MSNDDYDINALSRQFVHSANLPDIELLISHIAEVFSTVDLAIFDVGSDEEYLQEYLRENTQKLIISALKISMASLVANKRIGRDYRDIVYEEIDSIFIFALKLFQIESPSQPNLTVEHLSHGFDVIVDNKYSLFSQTRSGNDKMPINIKKFPVITR